MHCFLSLINSDIIMLFIFPVNPADIVNDRQDGNEYYASFAKVEMALVEKLWGAMKVSVFFCGF